MIAPQAMETQGHLGANSKTHVVGPMGQPLTLDDLPPTTNHRWVIWRKAELVIAVRGGLLSLDQACARYSLTSEEFLGWEQAIDRHGLAGLLTTQLQKHRSRL